VVRPAERNGFFESEENRAHQRRESLESAPLREFHRQESSLLEESPSLLTKAMKNMVVYCI
jgi:hypothetical protein